MEQPDCNAKNAVQKNLNFLTKTLSRAKPNLTYSFFANELTPGRTGRWPPELQTRKFGRPKDQSEESVAPCRRSSLIGWLFKGSKRLIRAGLIGGRRAQQDLGWAQTRSTFQRSQRPATRVTRAVSGSCEWPKPQQASHPRRHGQQTAGLSQLSS